LNDLIWSPYGQKNVRWEDSGLAAENTEDFCGPTKKKSADQKKRRLDGCIGIEARTREEEKKNAGCPPAECVVKMERDLSKLGNCPLGVQNPRAGVGTGDCSVADADDVPLGRSVLWGHGHRSSGGRS